MLTKYTISGNKIVETAEITAPISIYINPTEAEKKFLTEEIKIDEHTLGSALDPDELSRLEFEPEHTAIVFKRPNTYSGKEQLLFRVSSAGAFLFPDKLIVVLSEEIPNLFGGKVFSKVNSLNEVTLRIIYRSIFHFIEHLKVITLITEDLEGKINAAMENRYLINLFSLEKSLVYYLNAINANSYLIGKLKLNQQKMNLSTEEAEFLDDMNIENTQCFKQAEIYSNILASLMDARASIVGNNLNVLMKTLNIITIGIMVPTFVVSAFSMNVKIPLSTNPYAFWFIMSLAGMSLGAIILIWKKMKW